MLDLFLTIFASSYDLTMKQFVIGIVKIKNLTNRYLQIIEQSKNLI